MNNINIKANSDYSFNYTEHLVQKLPDKKTVMARIGIILLCAALCIGLFALMFKIPHIAVVAAVLIAYVTMMLWSFTNIEYEYVIASGEMSMDKIISAKRRKRMVEFKIPLAEKIIPYRDAKTDDRNVIFAVSSPKAEDAYCALFTTEKGEKTALVFNATKKSLDMLRYYNKNCIIDKNIQ